VLLPPVYKAKINILKCPNARGIPYQDRHPLKTIRSCVISDLQRGSSLFWDVTQRRLVISYRRFGTTYRFHLQRSSKPRFLLDYLTHEDGSDRLSRNVGNYQSTLRNIPEERRSDMNLHYTQKTNTGERTASSVAMLQLIQRFSFPVFCHMGLMPHTSITSIYC
jgi:hypothetical protein